MPATPATPAVSRSSFPNGAAIYAARYAEGLTWSEMRTRFSVSARSSRFLSECVAYVNGDADLLALHGDLAYIDVAGKTAATVGPNARDAIRAARSAGQGFSILRERTGLPTAELRKVVGEEVGTTARVAYGQRYGARKPAETETETTADAPVPADGPKGDDAGTLAADLSASLAAVEKRAPRKQRAPRKGRTQKGA